MRALLKELPLGCTPYTMRIFKDDHAEWGAPYDFAFIIVGRRMPNGVNRATIEGLAVEPEELCLRFGPLLINSVRDALRGEGFRRVHWERYVNGVRVLPDFEMDI